MIEVREVKTKKEIRDFLRFTEKHYKNNPYYVPELYSDQLKMFKKNYMYYDQAKAKCFNAYKDGVMVGRVQGIIQYAANTKHSEKKVRFTRFESIDDYEVSNALLDAVCNFGASEGMDTLCGPMGFSDLDREGMLIEGFDQISTFEEAYSYDYYPKLMDHYGLAKEVDWVERKLYPPKEIDPRFERFNDLIMKRYKLHLGQAKNKNDFIKKYGDKIFEIIDTTYKDLYGTVPFTKGMKDLMIANFKLIIDLRFVAVICDENERVVCFGITFPSIGEAIQKSKGHLTPLCIYRVLKLVKHPKVVDLGLIGVLPEYESKGVSSILIGFILKMFKDLNIEYAETLNNLEDNYKIINCWKNFDNVLHKRRRAYIKQFDIKNFEN